MLKIVHPICCGIDVHKKFVVATIASTNKNGLTTYKTENFDTFTKDLIRLKNWLLQNKCSEVCIESTGKYWIPLFNILEDTCKITVCNPKYVRAIPGQKTDKKDSIWLSDLHKHGLTRGSFIPPKPIRELRDLNRYYTKLVNMRSSEKMRFQNSLTVSNIMISSVVSDTFGKASLKIINALVESKDPASVDVESLIPKSMLSKKDLLVDSIQGTISNEQSLKLKLSLEHHDNINKLLEKLESEIERLSTPYQHQIDLLTTIPGISKRSAMAIISEIGVDMSVFNSSKQLCSWAGLTPQNNESAGKKKSVRVSRAGVYVKPLLVQCALALLIEKSLNPFQKRYQIIKKRRGHKRAIIAVARMLMACCYHLILKNEPFKHELYEPKKTFVPEVLDVVDDPQSTQAMIEYLNRLGYSVSKQATP